MPTENRSSNTEMVSVPEGYMLVERSIWTEQQVEAATACITRLKGVPGMRDCDLAMAAIDAAQCKAPDIALSDLIPAPQPHPEPIAWMVGTAFWWTKEEAERDAAAMGLPVVGLGPMTGSAPAEQHQGEPVTLPARKDPTQGWAVPGGVAKDDGWNACLDEIAKLGPLYSRPVQGEPVAWFMPELMDDKTIIGSKVKAGSFTFPLYAHADPGEVERLRLERRRMDQALSACANERDTLRVELDSMAETFGMQEDKIDALRAQLVERDALLRLDYQLLGLNNWHVSYRELMTQIDAALSASAEHKPFRTPDCPECACVQDGNCLCIPSAPSAEPSAPTPMPSYMEAACDKFDWTPEEALRFYAEGKHFDTDRGRTRILCTGAIASHALKGMSNEYADLKGSEQTVSSAPVERDERAAFEGACCEYFNALPSVTTPITPEQVKQTRDGDHYGHGSLGKNLRWAGWQMRAALERKPS